MKHYSPLLHRLVAAAEVECPHPHAAALSEFIALALRNVSSPVAFVPHTPRQPKLHPNIEANARAHFQLDQAVDAFRKARKAAHLALDTPHDTRPGRHRPEGAETAYFYAGLAFGLVFANSEDAAAAVRCRVESDGPHES